MSEAKRSESAKTFVHFNLFLCLLHFTGYSFLLCDVVCAFRFTAKSGLQAPLVCKSLRIGAFHEHVDLKALDRRRKR